MSWYKKFQLSRNPFLKNPKINADLIVKDIPKLKDLLYYVESDSIVIVRGEKNSGKTRFALEVLNTIKPKQKNLYIDLKHYNKNVDIEDILLSVQPMHRRLLKLYPKNIVLIIDNAFNFNPKFYHRLQYFYDQEYIKSAVIIYKADELVEIPPSIMSRVGSKYIDLSNMTKDSAIKIVSNRLKGKIFNDEHLDVIYSKSKGFEDFLSNCEKIAVHYANSRKDFSRKIDIHFIRRMLI